jgi:multimeric flavodoxin WrbA
MRPNSSGIYLGGMAMKILILTGSPRKKGNSRLLAEAFAKGAAEAGHEITRFDTADLDIHPCIACEYCRKDGHDTCVFKDDMQSIYPQLIAADLVVLATPLYYFGIAAQLKAAIDRFFAHNLKIRDKQAVLLAACGDGEEWVGEALKAHYLTICRYCRWQDAGMVVALGQYEIGDVEKSDYLAQAEALGKSL